MAIVPDRHGTGTNALLIAPPERDRRRASARAASNAIARRGGGGPLPRVEALPSLVLDVDTPDDLAALVGRLEDDERRAPRTRGALAQLEGRSRAPAPQARA